MTILIWNLTGKNLADPVEFVKNSFKPEMSAQTIAEIENKLRLQDNRINMDIYFQIDDYISSKIKKASRDMPRIYRNMRAYLKAFEHFPARPVTFDCLDLNFYEEFVDFLTYDYTLQRRKINVLGLKVNTAGITIKQFRTFLRNRTRKGIIPPIDMDGREIPEEEVDAVYLNRSEIGRIYRLDLSDYPHLINQRNDFVNRVNPEGVVRQS